MNISNKIDEQSGTALNAMRDTLQQGWRRARLLNYLLLPISWCYRLLMALRRSCYRMRLLRSDSLPVPVIVVGNISMGGSGKSPLVMALVDHLKARGFKPGVIARGYGGKSAFYPREVNRTTSAHLVGDEPQLIFERCDVAVVVGTKRVQNGTYLIDNMNCDILVSDDGYQHFALKRNIDIVVIDGQYGFGNGWCLPAGPLREPISALMRADIVVFNGQSPKQKHDEQSPKQWQHNIPSGCIACHMNMELQDARNLIDNSRRALSEFTDKPAHAVAGIGNPARFFSQLEQADIDIIPHIFPDHHKFTADDISFADNRPILMTEKDAIKCRSVATAKNIWVVVAHLHVDDTLYRHIDDLLANGVN